MWKMYERSSIMIMILKLALSAGNLNEAKTFVECFSS